MPSPEICPQCGALVPPNAKACPECGSDEATGWSERATSQRLDLPEEEFDYDEFLKEEFGAQTGPAVRPKGIKWFWWALALALALLALLSLSGLGRLFQ